MQTGIICTTFDHIVTGKLFAFHSFSFFPLALKWRQPEHLPACIGSCLLRVEEARCQPGSLDVPVGQSCPPVLNNPAILGLLHEKEVNMNFI